MAPNNTRRRTNLSNGLGHSNLTIEALLELRRFALRAVFVMVAVFPSLVTVHACAQTPTSERACNASSIMEGAKRATGGDAWNNIHSLHIHGSEISGNLPRSNDEWDDVNAGRYAVHVQSDLGSQAAGFDGISSWIQLYGDQSYKFGDEDSRLSAIDNAYQIALGYWFPERRAATMQCDGLRPEGGRTFAVVTITPEAGRPFSVWVDSATHLIDRIIEREAEGTSITKYSDYRNVSGVKFPFTRQQGWVGRDDWNLETVESVTINPTLSEDEFTLPALPAPDFEIKHGKQSTTVPFRLENNIILVPVVLNGQGPFWADFDSGGNYLLQPEVAAKLKLQAQGKKGAYGGGEASVASGKTIIDTVEIGDARIRRQTADVLEFYPEKPEMILIGSEILQRFAVHLDFDKMLLTLTPLDQFAYQGNGSVVPFHFQSNQPEVFGAVDGISGVFAIDTGDNGSLLLIAPFAKRYGLYEKYHATIPYGGGIAVGGETYGVVARVGQMSLFGQDGRTVVETTKPLTFLSQQKGGFDADRYVSGNIGLGILKQFNVTFDYRHQQIILEKNHLYGKGDPYNRTGLHLKQQGKSWVVSGLDPSSPAMGAGLKVGDAILAINGEDSTQLSEDEMKDLFRQPVGTTLNLVIGTQEKHRSVKLILEDLI